MLAAIAVWYILVQFSPVAPTVHGYGTSFSNLFISSVLQQFLGTIKFDNAPTIIYTNENEDDFSRIITGNETMFVAYDNPTQSQDLYADLIAFPIIAAAVTPIVRFTDDMPNPPIEDPFVLTRDNLVGIFNGTITRFCNISNLNPKWNMWICAKETVNLTAYHRKLASGTNFVFTSALSSFSDAWRKEYGCGLKTKWPSSIASELIDSNNAMIGAVALRPFSIGYTPVPDFKNYTQTNKLTNVHAVYIANPVKDGSTKLVSPLQPAALQSAVDYAVLSSGGVHWNQSLINLPCEDCWPISSYAYVVVRKDYAQRLGFRSLDSVYVTVRFLKYILQHGIDYGTQYLSYVSPPVAVVQGALQQISTIRFHGKVVQLSGRIQYHWMAIGIITALTIIAIVVRLAVPLCSRAASKDGRPMSRLTKDDIYDVNNHSLMRQILENEPSVTSARPPRMEETLRRAMIDTGEIVMQRQIGKGASGDVFVGTYIGAIVAIKRMLLPTNSERMGVVENFIREASTMAQLRHPNIVQFIGASVSHPYLYIITEYCTQGSLYDVLHGERKRQLTRKEKRNILIDAALGIMYLHGKGIVHRDIKTHNFLVDRTGTVKVADFGTSAALGLNLRAQGSENNMKTMVGTPEYVAPEVVTPKGNGYSYKADIYSFGIVAWEVWSGQQPYGDLPLIEIIFGVTTNGIRPPIDAIDEPELAKLIQRCWAQEPDQRPTFDEILEVLKDLDEEAE